MILVGIIDGRDVGTYDIDDIPMEVEDRLRRGETVSWSDIADPMDDHLYLSEDDIDSEWEWRLHLAG